MSTTTYVNSVTLSDATEWNRWDSAAYCVLTGVAGTNTITATGPANMVLTAPYNPFILIPAATNSGATTLNITPSGGSALTAKNVFSGGAACVGDELLIGVPALLVYDGTQFNIVGSIIRKGSTGSTFTFNGSGGTTASITMTLQRIGNFITVHFPAVTGTTGTGSTTLTSNTAVAATFRPTNTQTGSIMPITDNNANVAGAGRFSIAATGIITIQRDGTGTAFTDTATGGVGAATMIWYFLG